MLLKIAGYIKESVVDGPGIRFVVFFQGCPHLCPGCHNPETHDMAGGRDTDTEEVLQRMRESRLIRGLTLSGGEPFLQAEAALILARAARASRLNVVAYSGYQFEELLERGKSEPAVAQLLEEIDMLVDGPYMETRRDISLAFRGSCNQRLVDVPASLRHGKVVLWEKMPAVAS
jgi:anaerobic ribonucleoside-triphosphate reductase activating protein